MALMSFVRASSISAPQQADFASHQQEDQVDLSDCQSMGNKIQKSAHPEGSGRLGVELKQLFLRR